MLLEGRTAVNVSDTSEDRKQASKSVCVFSCVRFCNPMDWMGSSPGSSIHGILQVRMLEWVAMPSSRGSSQTRDQTHVSCIAARFFTH